MMNLVKTFFLIILILSIIFFLQLNDAKVSVNLIFAKFPNSPVSMIIFASLAIGILFGYLFAALSILAAKADIRSLQNKNKRLSDELNDLRNVAIDEGIYDIEDGEY